MALLCAYVAIEFVIGGLLAAGIDDLHFRLGWPEVAVWLALVIGVAVGWRLAWIALSGLTALGLLQSAVILAIQPRILGAIFLLPLMATQVALLLNRRFRSL